MACALGLGGWSEKTILPADILDIFKDIFKCCGPLIFIDADGSINLVHQSARDYLLGEYLQLYDRPSRYRAKTDTVNLLMFRICWRYPSMEEFKKGTAIIKRNEKNHLFPAKLSDQYLNSHNFLRYEAEEGQEHALAAGRALETDYGFKKDNLDKVPTLRDAPGCCSRTRGGSAATA
jgi:hypothetical protein